MKGAPRSSFRVTRSDAVWAGLVFILTLSYCLLNVQRTFMPNNWHRDGLICYSVRRDVVKRKGA